MNRYRYFRLSFSVSLEPKAPVDGKDSAPNPTPKIQISNKSQRQDVSTHCPRSSLTRASLFKHFPLHRLHLLGVLRAERADGLSGAPDLKVVNLLELLVVLLTVVGLRVVLKRALGLAAVLNGGVQVIEDRLEGSLEALAPVDSATAGGGRAGSVHVVHAVGTDQRVQRLGGLLDGLVESLRRAVAALTEDLVLREEHAVDTAHEAATLAVQVRVHLLLEGGLVEVSGTDGDTEGDGLLLGLAGDVLEDGNGGVDATALAEESADGAAGTLGGDEDDIDVGGDLDLGEVLEDGGEAVGEVKSLLRLVSMSLISGRLCAYLALGELGLDSGPGLGLGSIGEQVHDNSRLANRLIDIEEVLAGNPAILLSLLPRGTVLPHTDNDVQAVVAEVETLAVTLGAVADEGKGVVLEVLLVYLLAGAPIEIKFDAIEACVDSQEASPLASHHALFAFVSGRSNCKTRLHTYRRRSPWCRRSQSS